MCRHRRDSRGRIRNAIAHIPPTANAAAGTSAVHDQPCHLRKRPAMTSMPMFADCEMRRSVRQRADLPASTWSMRSSRRAARTSGDSRSVSPVCPTRRFEPIGCSNRVACKTGSRAIGMDGASVDVCGSI